MQPSFEGVEERLRGVPFGLVEAAGEQRYDDGGVARGVGQRRGTFEAAQQRGLCNHVGDVFEQRAQAASGRSKVVKPLLCRLSNETPARPFETTSLGFDRAREPFHWG